ncbi:MAG: carbamoyltransferase HypF [bacterium]|nr:carbamoyltransferase HypF [bacterium]
MKNSNTNPLTRYGFLIKGIVQGVGFRPFLYRCAHKFNLTGFVKNNSQGVIMEVEGKEEDVKAFSSFIIASPPPLSQIQHCESREIPVQSSTSFEIIASEETPGEQGDLLISPDIAICKNCSDELFTPKDRRYRYPFINCTDCGPRFSIIHTLPYDRPKTTMKDFVMCANCQKEYTDPYDRRYHAQPVSCYDCGPVLSLHDRSGNSLENPLDTACQKLKEGRVVAIKGLGGYHLACKASDDQSVLRLRALKGREKKPFALMGSMEMILKNALVSGKEEELLRSVSAPILLLKKRKNNAISKEVAPDQDYIGFMLPYTPLHLLLLDTVKEPLVLTSANISDEPIIYRDTPAGYTGESDPAGYTKGTGEAESGTAALRELSDYVLSNNREIYIFADDSVARTFDNKLYMIRRSRGYVPVPLKVEFDYPGTILALGPMLKTTFTFLYKNKAMMSQHIGNTDSPASIEAEKKAIRHLMEVFGLQPDIVVMDKHPGYPNREIAAEFKDADVVEIQHHEAHVGSLLAEYGVKEKIIGISMDGTGYGDDGNIWGGEFFVGDYRGLERFGHLKYLFMPSGDLSAKEPWRFALSILHTLYGSSDIVKKFGEPMGKKAAFLLEAIEKKAGGVLTSSCGRLFDGVASILGIGNFNGYEGELPIRLQAYAQRAKPIDASYSYSIENNYQKKKCRVLNMLPAIHDIIEDERDTTIKAYLFHRTLASAVAEMAGDAAKKYGTGTVGLTGGVFQNTLLLEMTGELLKKQGLSVLIHSEVPPNDGGISLGQAYLAAGKKIKEQK